MTLLVDAFVFFLEAGVANAAPIPLAQIKRLQPAGIAIDGGRTYRGKRLFGANKTWRGLVGGSLLAGLVGLLLSLHIGQFAAWGLDFSVALLDSSPFLVGSAVGFGALAGDVIESFLKRQRGIGSGKKWFPFDQIDYIIGGLVASSFFVSLTLEFMVIIFAVWFGMHILFSYIGYLIGWKKSPI